MPTEIGVLSAGYSKDRRDLKGILAGLKDAGLTSAIAYEWTYDKVTKTVNKVTIDPTEASKSDVAIYAAFAEGNWGDNLGPLAQELVKEMAIDIFVGTSTPAILNL